MNELIEITCEVTHETDNALLINDGATETWIPKSQIASTDEHATGTVTIEIPEWLAQAKGLI